MTDVGRKLRELASTKHNNVIDHVAGVGVAALLRVVTDPDRLQIIEVYPYHPGQEEEHGDTFLIDGVYLSDPEGVKDVLDKWWNRRGRMTFASSNDGLHEDKWGRHPLIKIWGELDD